MKQMIDIPNSLYANLQKIQNGSIACKRILETVKNGTPLSELEDCISRQAAIDTYKNLRLPIYPLEELPPVKPEQKMGHWIKIDDCSNSGYYCSKCHKKVVKDGWSDTVKIIKYCPNCGAKMEDEK